MAKESSKPERPDRTLLEFAPLIYVAWSDGLLTEGEVDLIRSRVATGALSPKVQRVLDEWLNPAKPPSPAQLYNLLEMMRGAGGKTRKRFGSLFELGRFLGKRNASGPELDSEEMTPELLALKEVEQALGLDGYQSILKILNSSSATLALEMPVHVDPQQLVYLIDGERHDVRRLVFGVLQRPAFDDVDTSDIPAYRAAVLRWCHELARLGVTGYGFPREYGGEGNIPKSIAVFETLAYHDMSMMVKFGVHFGLFGGSILQLGTRKHHDAYLAQVISLELPGCFAMTETGHGSNVRDIQTVASYDVGTGEFVIDSPSRDAWKDYIGNAAQHAQMATVFAQLEVNGEMHGVHAFLVRLRDAEGNIMPGIHIEDNGRKIGLNGVDNGRIAFTNVRIPRDQLLDRFGSVAPDGKYTSSIDSPGKRFFTMLGTLVAGRISIAAASCSATKLGLAIATRYAARRTQFGPENAPEVPILTYRSVQNELLPRIARTYALDCAIHDTIRLFAEPEPDIRELELRAAALKAAASRHAVDSLQYARELCGGQGYMWENRLGELRADTDIFTTFEGANNVLLQLVAKGLLTELREQFEDLGVWMAVRHVTARASTAVAELNPVITRKTDEDHLRDPEFHMAALRYREGRLLRSVAARMRSMMGNGRDGFDVVNQVQDHMMKLATAYTERLAFESLQRRAEKAARTDLGEAMRRIAEIYALGVIADDRGWFIESGYLETAKSKAIRTLLARLCSEMHENAPALVDGWGIPERYLAPIAR